MAGIFVLCYQSDNYLNGLSMYGYIAAYYDESNRADLRHIQNDTVEC